MWETISLISRDILAQLANIIIIIEISRRFYYVKRYKNNHILFYDTSFVKYLIVDQYFV